MRISDLLKKTLITMAIVIPAIAILIGLALLCLMLFIFSPILGSLSLLFLIFSMIFGLEYYDQVK